MSKKTIAKSFVNQFVALVTGDDATQKAENTFRVAVAGLKTQISIAEGKEVELEESVRTVKDKADKALLNNGNTDIKGETYVKALVNAKNAVTEAEEALEAHLAYKEFLVSKLDEITEAK